jgi:iron complex transport system ATP-binding protein
MGELNTAISINNLTFLYDKIAVLHETSVSIKTSSLTVILGKNGSGKSTLLRIIAGLLPYKQGDIKIYNQELKNITLRNRAKLFGFLGQKHKAVFPFTVEQVVLTGRSGFVNFIPKENDVEITINALKKAGIFHLKERYYTELSGGEQQLVMIARVLAQEPKILLLDEPTTHLDFCNQIKLLTLLKNLTRHNMTVVAVLHDPNIAFLYGDDFIFVKNNKLIRPDEPVKPWDAEFLKNIYENELQSIPYSGRALIVPVISNDVKND